MEYLGPIEGSNLRNVVPQGMYIAFYLSLRFFRDQPNTDILTVGQDKQIFWKHALLSERMKKSGVPRKIIRIHPFITNCH